MNLTKHPKAILAAALFALSSLSHAAPKNIVFFIVDDMSPDTGAYGNSAIQTPHLDALAADGTLFTHAFATTASCSASRSVVLTGQHNHANGQYGHTHDFHGFESWKKIRGLPVLLSECGYRTCQIGKLHVAPQEVYHFDSYLKGGAGNPVAMAETCKEFLSAEDDRPFFLYFATSDPHRGGGVDETSPYKPDLFGNKPNKGNHTGVDEIFYDPAKVVVPPFLTDSPETRAELAQYYQSISRIDQGVGRLVEILKETGKWDDTLFVFTADHGMAFAGAKTNVYEAALKVPFIVRNPYVEERKPRSQAMLSFVDITPTLLDFAGGYDPVKRGPKKPDSRKLSRTGRSENPGHRRTNPNRFHGRSFLPVLEDPEASGWDTIYASHTFHEIQMYYPMRVVRDRKFKLIWNVAYRQPYPFASDLWVAPSWQAQWKKGMQAPYGTKTVASYVQRPQFELYAVGEDPHESKNLASDSAYADVLEAYKTKLKTFQEETGDPWVLKWEYE